MPKVRKKERKKASSSPSVEINKIRTELTKARSNQTEERWNLYMDQSIGWPVPRSASWPLGSAAMAEGGGGGEGEEDASPALSFSEWAPHPADGHSSLSSPSPVRPLSRSDAQRTSGSISLEVSIFRVPRWIRDAHPQAYTPCVMSLGLYHHLSLTSNPNNVPIDAAAAPDGVNANTMMEVYKNRALKRALSRLCIDFPTLVSQMQPLQRHIRHCYDDFAWYSVGMLGFSAEQVMSIITRDACFLLEFLRPPPSLEEADTAGEEGKQQRQRMNLIFDDNGKQNVMRLEIMNDIVKLENQIPLAVLRRILVLEQGSGPEALKSLVSILKRFHLFRGFPFRKLPSALLAQALDRAAHLLDLCRLLAHGFLEEPPPHSVCLKISSSHNNSSSANQYISIRSATALRQAGIEFREETECGNVRFVREGGSWRDARLFLPQITVDGNTENIVRNIMALEECLACKLYPAPKTLSHYLRLVDGLVDTAQDVALLRSCGIVRSFMGSDQQVAAMFNSLCNSVLVREWGHYQNVVEHLTRHYQCRWNVRFSEFKDRYFSNPWYVPATVAVALELAFSAVQTYCALTR